MRDEDVFFFFSFDLFQLMRLLIFLPFAHFLAV